MFVTILKQSLSGFPIECREFETHAEALAAYPDCPVMSVQAYNEWAQQLAQSHPQPKPQHGPGGEIMAVQPVRWWQFWRWFQ